MLFLKFEITTMWPLDRSVTPLGDKCSLPMRVTAHTIFPLDAPASIPCARIPRFSLENGITKWMDDLSLSNWEPDIEKKSDVVEWEFSWRKETTGDKNPSGKNGAQSNYNDGNRLGISVD